MTLCTLAYQQQVATLDGSGGIGDRHFVAALPAPDVGQQTLADIYGDGLPTLACGAGEIGKILNGHGSFLTISTCATTGMRIQPALPKGGQAVTLTAAVGLVGQGHFDDALLQRRCQIGLAKMLPVGQP